MSSHAFGASSPQTYIKPRERRTREGEKVLIFALELPEKYTKFSAHRFKSASYGTYVA